MISGRMVYRLVGEYNDVMEDNRYDDDMIYLTDEIDELFDGIKPLKLLNMLGDFDSGDPFFGFDGRGYMISYSPWEALKVMIDNLSDIDKDVLPDDLQELMEDAEEEAKEERRCK